MNRPMCTALLAAMVALTMAATAHAEVTRVEITERAAFAPGMRFGHAGAYERIRAVAYFSLDPLAPANARLVNLKHAMRDGRGRVRFRSEFVLLRPVRPRDSTLLYDVNNRGSIAILGQVNGHSPANNDPSSAADAGGGFLMRHGFTLLFSAWTWDVAPRVPAPDANGNDRGGVRLVELVVPLGTHTGWNQRAADTGFPWATARFDGNFVPFARSEQERRAAGDPRPSLAERYPTREDFVTQVHAAASRQVAAGFLLEEDRARAIAESVGLYDRILAHDPNDPGCAYLYPD